MSSACSGLAMRAVPPSSVVVPARRAVMQVVAIRVLPRAFIAVMVCERNAHHADIDQVIGSRHARCVRRPSGRPWRPGWASKAGGLACLR